MPLTLLPQEILDHVIDHFHSDLPTLRICALVSHTWLPSSRVHIFHTVSLHPPTKSASSRLWRFLEKPTACQRLHLVLGASPAIVPCIRHVVIREGILSKEWIAQERTLPLLLHSLTHVRRLELERSASMRLEWRALTGTLQGAVRAVLRLGSFSELKLVGLVLERPADLLQILSECPGLRVLQASHVSFVKDTLGPSEGLAASGGQWFSSSSSLKVLSIGPRTSPTIVDCLLHPDSPIDLTGVDHLSLSISNNFAAFARLLRATAHVKSLELVLMNDIDLKQYWTLPLGSRFDISHNPHLQRLEFKIDVIQRQDDPLPWLQALLATVQVPNALRDIYIVYSLFLPAPYMDRPEELTTFETWLEIDATLSEPVFHALRRVRLHFSLENPLGFGVAPRFLNEVKLLSPALRAAGVLEIDAFDTSR